MSDDTNKTGPAEPTVGDTGVTLTGPADPTAGELDSLNNAGALIRAGAYSPDEAFDFLEASHPGARSRDEWATLLGRIGACTDCQA